MHDTDYRSLFRATPVLTLVLDPELRIVDATDELERVTGVKVADVKGRLLAEAFPAQADAESTRAFDAVHRSLARVLETRKPDVVGVRRYDFPDEQGVLRARYWSVSNHPVLEQGQVRAILHRNEDVTEFVLANKTAQSSLDGMAAEILQRSREIHDANVELHHTRAALEAMNQDLEARVAARTAELWQANQALQAEMRERERLEEQFRQSQKLEAIGHLAGGIAHDFNNLLTVIIGCAESLRTEAMGELGRADLLEIRQAAMRAASLTRQLLAFSRRNETSPAVLELDEVVRGAEAMLRRLVGEHLSFHTELAALSATIEADRGLVEQALMNLVVNARDAMPRGGKLTIETREVSLGAQTPGALLGAPPGAYVMLAVHDTGEGMAPGVQARAFLPFFTTKEKGRGTGLGLSMVHGVVKQAGGELVLESAPGRGTTFRLYFPLAHVPAGRRAAAQLALPMPIARGTVLLVEDDPQVRAVAQRALSQEGYTVISSALPTEALGWCHAHPTPVDLLLTDVVMPGMDGPSLVEQVRRLRPEVRALFMSGYTVGALPGGVKDFLPKPFTPQQLVDRVHTALGRKGSKNSRAAGS